MSSTAAEMSPTRFPGTAAAMPAIIASCVAVTRSRVSSGTSPTTNVRAPSPCHPSRIAPTSTETIWPSRITRSPGMPWTTSSSSEMQVLAGNAAGSAPVPAPAQVAQERRGRRPRRGYGVRRARRDGRWSTPGRSSPSTRARTSATTRPRPAHQLDFALRLPGDHVSSSAARRVPSRPGPRAATRAAATSSIGLASIDGAEHAGVPVVGLDLAQVVERPDEARPDRLGSVVGALDERRSVDVADPGLRVAD